MSSNYLLRTLRLAPQSHQLTRGREPPVVVLVGAERFLIQSLQMLVRPARRQEPRYAVNSSCSCEVVNAETRVSAMVPNQYADVASTETSKRAVSMSCMPKQQKSR